MTFVAAQRFGQRIIMIADTKISNKTLIGRFDPAAGVTRDRSEYANNYIPGRLKAFPISVNLSIGYAGCSQVALGVIKDLMNNFEDLDDLGAIIEMLRRGTSNSKADFLLVSHIAGPQIFKIHHGSVCDDQYFHWIGAGEVSKDLAVATAKARERYRAWAGETPDYVEPEELELISGWSDLLLQAPALTQEVGGFPVVVLGVANGHCFQMSAAACNSDAVIRGDGSWFNEDGQLVGQFYGQYGFAPVCGSGRGAPVLGIWMQEQSLGYLYDPLVNDEALVYSRTTMDAFGAIVRKRAEERSPKA